MRALVLVVPLLLTACASPASRETCINNVTRDAQVLNQLIEVTRENLARGFALERQQEIRNSRISCRFNHRNRSSSRSRCNNIRTITRNVPVAIDLNEERAKLASLEERQAQNQATQQAALTQCLSRFPA